MKPTDLRGILQYIPRFREQTFVISADGAVVSDVNFTNLLLDIAVLRSLKTALTNLTIEKHGAGGKLDNNTEIGVVRTAIKQRHDSVEQFEKAGRQDLADNEKAEIAILNNYLPATLREEEITQFRKFRIDFLNSETHELLLLNYIR